MTHPFFNREFFTRPRLIGAAVVILAVVAVAAIFHFMGGADTEAPAEPTAQIQTAPATRGSLSATALAYGTVASASGHTRVIAMPHDGMIASLAVHDGEAVRAGQPIVTIAIAPAAATQYAQARSAIDFAKQDLARIERLFADKLASNDQLATARKALADAQAQLDQQTGIGADRTMDTLRAPFDGVVSGLNANPGDRPQMGAAIATLSSRSDLVVQLGLEPDDARKVAAGAAVRLTDPLNPSVVISARLISVGAIIDPTSRLVKAVAEIPAADAAHVGLGMTLVARVDLPARSGIIIPRAALLEDADGPYLFTVVAGKAHRQSVKVALETNDQALLDSGVASGTRVVVSGNAALEDGVVVQETKP